jgi:hypothetical protein
MITGKPFKFFWAKIREYNLKEIHDFLPQPHCPNTVRELGLVHDSTGATPTSSLHGPPRGTSILSRSSWGPSISGGLSSSCGPSYSSCSPSSRWGHCSSWCPFSSICSVVQDAEILQAAAALPAAGVIRLVAVDLQAAEPLPQAAGNLQLEAAINSLSRASVKLQVARARLRAAVRLPPPAEDLQAVQELQEAGYRSS